jgi:hypothetical protein
VALRAGYQPADRARGRRRGPPYPARRRPRRPGRHRARPRAAAPARPAGAAGLLHRAGRCHGAGGDTGEVTQVPGRRSPARGDHDPAAGAADGHVAHPLLEASERVRQIRPLGIGDAPQPYGPVLHRASQQGAGRVEGQLVELRSVGVRKTDCARRARLRPVPYVPQLQPRPVGRLQERPGGCGHQAAVGETTATPRLSGVSCVGSRRCSPEAGSHRVSGPGMRTSCPSGVKEMLPS